MEISKLKEYIDSSKTIVLGSHLNPDGDNIGSLLGLYHALKNIGKSVMIIEDDNIPKEYDFIITNEKIVTSKNISNCDLFIALDCSDQYRMSQDAVGVFNRAGKTINIDHHKTNTKFADLNIVDYKSPATGEIVYGLLKKLGFEIDKVTATALYAAISSDTGSFKYDSVTPYTHEAAADLLRLGANAREVTINLYQRKSKEKTNLLIKTLNGMEFHHNGMISIATLSKELLNSCSAKDDDSEGIVEFLRDIDGVEVAVFLKEKNNAIRLSLRTKSYLDASLIASKVNGGGHERAAGATMEMSLKDAKNKILDIIIKEITCKES